MDDRTLLEKAAKAAGYDTSHAWNAYRMTLNPPVIALCIPGVNTGWNPLDDDGQALRLAVKLGLDVTSLQAGISWDSTSRYADTRRAIVRAAAAMADKGE